jgi:hypothetical protein
MKLAWLRGLVLGFVDLVAACSVAALVLAFEVARAEGLLGRALWAGHSAGKRVLGVNIIWLIIAWVCGFVWLLARYMKRLLAILEAKHPALHSAMTRYPHFMGLAIGILLLVLQAIIDHMIVAIGGVSQ